ncbi:MAG: tRNA pseudouridine(38-40) synthase TruA [Armatimonadetes bacterium]|nr:tRNA pseudouridine(38-40) synthase TruA [Armatimonadota bacterium]
MRNIRLVLAYEGTAYHGFQRQPNAPTVQEAVEKKLACITGEPAQVIVAGRTDAGVHATGQVINFHTSGRIPIERVVLAFNGIAPFDIVARHPAEVPLEFHARFSARARTYRYYLWRAGPSPFLRRYTCRVRLPADAPERMRTALSALIGEHDFTSFCAAGAETDTRVRTVTQASLTEHGPLLRLTMTADGFLQSMVRIVTGTLLEIGVGKREPAEMAEILAARDRTVAGETVPPYGLFLTRVAY